MLCITQRLMKMEKKKMAIIILFILALVLCSGCTQKIKADALTRLSYSNREFGFGLNTPADWILDMNESYGNYAIFNCPQNESNIPVSMSINATQVNSSETLHSYYGRFIDENERSGKISNYTLISRKDRPISSSISLIAYENTYTYTIYDSNIIKVRNLLINPKEDVIICFQYITPVSTYGTFEFDFEFSLVSLTFI